MPCRIFCRESWNARGTAIGSRYDRPFLTAVTMGRSGSGRHIVPYSMYIYLDAFRVGILQHHRCRGIFKNAAAETNHQFETLHFLQGTWRYFVQDGCFVVSCQLWNRLDSGILFIFGVSSIHQFAYWCLLCQIYLCIISSICLFVTLVVFICSCKYYIRFLPTMETSTHVLFCSSE